MKKLILLFLLFYSFAYSQVDTANYNFNVDLLTGKYTSIISKSPVFGAQGFKYLVQELQATSIDTTQFQYVGNIDGKYTIIQNIVPYYGKDSGTVQMQLFNAPTTTNPFVTDSANILWKNRNRTITSRFTFSDKQVFSDSADVNTLTADTIKANFVYKQDSLLATENWVKNNAQRPYKVYTVLLNQSDTNAPVPTVLENTLGVTPTWSYNTAGSYNLNSTGLFLASKTFIVETYGLASEDLSNTYTLVRDNDDRLLLVSGSGDDRLINTPIEIRIYY